MALCFKGGRGGISTLRFVKVWCGRDGTVETDVRTTVMQLATTGGWRSRQTRSGSASGTDFEMVAAILLSQDVHLSYGGHIARPVLGAGSQAAGHSVAHHQLPSVRHPRSGDEHSVTVSD